MQHVIVIRSAYGPDVPLEVNEVRLRITEAVCVPSLAAQTCKEFVIELRVDLNDPFGERRIAAFTAIGAELYLNQPNARCVPCIQTRMDDDDAIARDFVERVQLAESASSEWLTFPNGMVASADGWTPRHQVNNQFVTRVSSESVMAVKHGDVHGAIIDERPAWLWVRHRHARSGMKRPKATQPLEELTEWFGVDVDAMREAIR